MGNQVEKLSHLTYDELPTADPTGYEAHDDSSDCPRIGVSYIFSNDDEEGEEEGGETPDAQDCDVGAEIGCCVYFREDWIYDRPSSVAGLQSAVDLVDRVGPGDLLEFVAVSQLPHWVVCTDHGQIVHLHRDAVTADDLLEAARGRRGRVVNELYRFPALSPDAVVRNALSQVGRKEAVGCWRNSESFAAWCRFGRREFKIGGELRVGKQPYRMTLRLSDSDSHDLHFQSLEDVIAEKRRNDLIGKDAVIRELVNHLNNSSEEQNSDHSAD